MTAVLLDLPEDIAPALKARAAEAGVPLETVTLECVRDGFALRGLKRPKLTAERLRMLLDYDLETGIFRWRDKQTGRCPQGSKAGSLDSNGRLRIRIDGVRHAAHRLAWLYVFDQWPKQAIDHKDCDPLNNRIENLREASYYENNGNRRFSGSHSGFKGVDFVKGRWRARFGRRYLGSFATAEQASQAYFDFAQQTFGEFARR